MLHLVQKLQGDVTHTKNDMFGRQRKKQEGQQRHQYEVTNKYVFKCCLKVDSDGDDVTNDGIYCSTRGQRRPGKRDLSLPL